MVCIDNPRRQFYKRGKRHDVQEVKNTIEPTIQTGLYRRVAATGRSSQANHRRVAVAAAAVHVTHDWK